MRWLFLTVVVLSGCQTVEDVDPITEIEPPEEVETTTEEPAEAVQPSGLIERTPDSCGVSENEELVGQPVETFNQDAWPEPVRVVAPGSIITTDYNAKRINLDIDKSGTITRIWCG